MSHDGLWWRVAWRNLWRNSHRTWITASGLAFGYFSSVVLIGLTDGMTAELVDNGTRLMVGQVQVHAADFLPERNMHHTIGEMFAPTVIEPVLLHSVTPILPSI